MCTIMQKTKKCNLFNTDVRWCVSQRCYMHLVASSKLVWNPGCKWYVEFSRCSHMLCTLIMLCGWYVVWGFIFNVTENKWQKALRYKSSKYVVCSSYYVVYNYKPYLRHSSDVTKLTTMTVLRTHSDKLESGGLRSSSDNSYSTESRTSIKLTHAVILSAAVQRGATQRAPSHGLWVSNRIRMRGARSQSWKPQSSYSSSCSYSREDMSRPRFWAVCLDGIRCVSWLGEGAGKARSNGARCCEPTSCAFRCRGWPWALRHTWPRAVLRFASF